MLFEECELDQKRLRFFLRSLKITPYLGFASQIVRQYAAGADVAGLLDEFIEKYDKLNDARH